MFDKKLLLRHIENQYKTIEEQLNEQSGGIIPRIAPSQQDRKVVSFGSSDMPPPQSAEEARRRREADMRGEELMRNPAAAARRAGERTELSPGRPVNPFDVYGMGPKQSRKEDAPTSTKAPTSTEVELIGPDGGPIFGNKSGGVSMTRKPASDEVVDRYLKPKQPKFTPNPSRNMDPGFNKTLPPRMIPHPFKPGKMIPAPGPVKMPSYEVPEGSRLGYKDKIKYQ